MAPMPPVITTETVQTERGLIEDKQDDPNIKNIQTGKGHQIEEEVEDVVNEILNIEPEIAFETNFESDQNVGVKCSKLWALNILLSSCGALGISFGMYKKQWSAQEVIMKIQEQKLKKETKPCTVQYNNTLYFKNWCEFSASEI